MREIFNGFISWDSKFWTTLIPLLTKPGKVSKDFINGKRTRYTNPFQFYLTASVIFFLILGLSKSIEKFQSLQNGSTKKQQTSVADINNSIKKEVDIDSLKNTINENLNNSWPPIDSTKRKSIVDEIEKQAKKDTLKNKTPNIIQFGGNTRLDKFISYQKEYPDMEIDDALDSLKFEKTFFNRFFYNRAQIANSFVNKKESREQFFNQALSYGSIALFVFLPIFTLFLKFFYIRRKYTYVEHLIFVFHTQTVFFMLLSIFFLLELFGLDPEVWIFTLLFVIYLFIAMKKFYDQGYFKTFLKFSLLNFSYLFIASIGVGIVFLISFALY